LAEGTATTGEVGRKTMQGATLMVLRTLVLYPIGFVGEVCLARLLSPGDFGVYAIASFLTVAMAAVMEVGLAASLIQRQEEPREEEYQTLFTLQLLGISLVVLLVFVTAPWIFPLLRFDPGIRWILLVLLLNPWISSFATTSVVKLERSLRYAVFARMDVLRGISYVGIAVPLAYYGAGAWSFAAAIIVSTAVKTWVAYGEAPWPVRFRLQLRGMRQTLHFGAIFQLSTLTSLARDHIGVVLGGPLFGAQSVGYLNWAKNTTYYTSQIFAQVVSRVAFPSISRVQNDRQSVGRMTEMIFKYVNLLTFPVILIFAALIPEFVAVVYTNKWAPAIPAFLWYSLRMLGSNVTTLYISVLNALGGVKTSLRILCCWTLADWILALALAGPCGFSGIALAYGLSVIPVSFWLIRELAPRAPVNLRRSLYVPLLAAGVSAALVFVGKTFFAPSWVSLVGLVIAGSAVYLLGILGLERQSLFSEGKIFLSAVFRRDSV
jgi:O-antigen/teichoic acid export membrane protein